MGHQITWDNEDKSVVLQQYTPNASKEDLFALCTKSAEMLQTVNHTVYLIIDERNIKLTLTSADMHFLEKYTPSNQGAVVMVIPKSEVYYKNMVQRIGQTTAPKAFELTYFVSSIDEARTLLQETFGVRYP